MGLMFPQIEAPDPYRYFAFRQQADAQRQAEAAQQQQLAMQMAKANQEAMARAAAAGYLNTPNAKTLRTFRTVDPFGSMKVTESRSKQQLDQEKAQREQQMFGVDLQKKQFDAEDAQRVQALGGVERAQGLLGLVKKNVALYPQVRQRLLDEGLLPPDALPEDRMDPQIMQSAEQLLQTRRASLETAADRPKLTSFGQALTEEGLEPGTPEYVRRRKEESMAGVEAKKWDAFAKRVAGEDRNALQVAKVAMLFIDEVNKAQTDTELAVAVARARGVIQNLDPELGKQMPSDVGGAMDFAQTVVTQGRAAEASKQGTLDAKKGRELSAELITQLADYETAGKLLDDLGAAFNTQTGWESFVTQFIPNSETMEFKDKRDATAQVVGSILEGGKLAEGDYKKYVPMLPGPTDTAERAAAKRENIKNLINTKSAERLKTLGQAGYDVSGFKGGQTKVDERRFADLKAQVDSFGAELRRSGMADAEVQRRIMERYGPAIERARAEMGGGQ